MLQCFPIKPSWQPIVQIPLTWSHGLLFKQWPLQRSLQFTPKWPREHSDFQKNEKKYVINNKHFYYWFWDMIYNKRMWYICWQFQYTFATIRVGISRVTSSITMTSLFVTWKVVQTMTTTVVHTVISIGPVITFYNIPITHSVTDYINTKNK